MARGRVPGRFVAGSVKGAGVFSVGDKIVYGGMGVCAVEDIAVPDLPGFTRKCYILKPLYQQGATVYAPIDKNPVNMRLLMPKQQAQTLIDGLPGLEGLDMGSDRHTIHDTCRRVIKSADSFLLARLLKTLHIKKRLVASQKKTLPGAEKDFFDAAERILFGELATVLCIPMEQVEQRIAPHLSQH